MQKKTRMAGTNEKTPARRTRVWGLTILVAGAAMVFVWAIRERLTDERRGAVPGAGVRSQTASGYPIPPFYQDPREAEPFPETLSPSRFADPIVVRAYKIAQEIPEVLAQQPCYCYCDGYGHGSLLHCYTDGHGAG